MPILVPDNIWKLAERACLKSQLEELLLAGKPSEAVAFVEAEGTAVAQELNTKREAREEPYSFEASVENRVRLKQSREDQEYLLALQQLHRALLSTYGRPMQADPKKHYLKLAVTQI